ncbi:hypothetical protein LTR04_003181 [Oleoguttula sp. CCFEE 6159]|nr:hypothetical protein LTR04_003181 [Oleoguttula sp. CCFEE 6159]
MSSSPQTPFHHRHHSSIDTAPSRYSLSRRSSACSAPPSPATSRSIPLNGNHRLSFGSVTSRKDDYSALGGLEEGNGNGNGNGNGFGNLADELADAWDEDESGYMDEGTSMLSPAAEQDGVGVNGIHHADEVSLNGRTVDDQQSDVDDDEEIGIHAAYTSSPLPPLAKLTNGSSHLPSRGTKHRRKFSRAASPDGDDSDPEAPDALSPELESQIAAIERLARTGLPPTDSISTTFLQDLGGQTTLEAHTTRLTNTHNSLTAYLTTQTRLLASLASTLFSPLAPPPAPESIDVLLPLLATALTALPRPSTRPLHALHALSASTAALHAALAALADSAHLTRQSSNAAARHLRGTRDVLAQLRREHEARDAGVRWIEAGDWARRLAARECASECGQVVAGFESVCEGWRERLAAQGGGVEAVV